MVKAKASACIRGADPWGFILFKRNIDTPEQVRVLVLELRDMVGWKAPVLIDQEGGRVQRLGPPYWPQYPPGAFYSTIHHIHREARLAAAQGRARLIAHDLIDL